MSLEHAKLLPPELVCSNGSACSVEGDPPTKKRKKSKLKRRFGYVSSATIAKRKAKAQARTAQEQTDKAEENADMQELTGTSDDAGADSASANISPIVHAVTGTASSTGDCMQKGVNDEVDSSVGEEEAASKDLTEAGNADQSDAESQEQLQQAVAAQLTEESTEREDHRLNNVLPEKVFDGDAGCFEEPVKKRRYFPRKERYWLFKKKVNPDAKPPVRKPAKPVQKKRVVIDPAILAQLPAKVQTRGMLRRAEKGSVSTEDKEDSDATKKAAAKSSASKKAAVKIPVQDVEKIHVPILENFYDEASGKFHDSEIMEEFETAVLLPEPVAGETCSALKQMLEKPVQRLMLKSFRSEQKAIRLQKQQETRAQKNSFIEVRQVCKKVSKKDFPKGLSQREEDHLYYRLSRGMPYRCRDCDSSFSLFGEFKDHLFQALDAVYKYMCVHCEAIFLHFKDMKAHAQQHMFDLPFKCSRCPASFATRTGVLQHFPIHKTTTPHLCPYCGKSFAIRTYLQQHITIHTGELRYKCQYCGKGFAGISTRRYHERIHTGEKPYKCPQCPYCCPKPDQLSMHMRSHTGERPNPCPDCPFRGRCKADLNRHRRRMHKPSVRTLPAGFSGDEELV